MIEKLPLGLPLGLPLCPAGNGVPTGIPSALRSAVTPLFDTRYYAHQSNHLGKADERLDSVICLAEHTIVPGGKGKVVKPESPESLRLPERVDDDHEK